eukprot:GHVU01206874.1.p1 GENE.GHVU01206874.1~~GHVU01206874.1.p1  ORF type:complete len:218 (-),score=7.59 GHVU01206874.1:144-776(-)
MRTKQHHNALELEQNVPTWDYTLVVPGRNTVSHPIHGLYLSQRLIGGTTTVRSGGITETPSTNTRRRGINHPSPNQPDSGDRKGFLAPVLVMFSYPTSNISAQMGTYIPWSVRSLTRTIDCCCIQKYRQEIIQTVHKVKVQKYIQQTSLKFRTVCGSGILPDKRHNRIWKGFHGKNDMDWVTLVTRSHCRVFFGSAVGVYFWIELDQFST